MSPRRSLPQRVSDSFRVIKELDLSHVYEAQAGTIALVALGVVLVGGFLLTGRVLRGGPPVEFVAEFPESRGLNGGDPVIVSGVRVGRVRAVELMGSGRVAVTLAVDPAHRPRSDARVEIVSVNLMGDRAVSYRPGGAEELLAPGMRLAGRTPDDVTSRMLDVRERAEVVAVEAQAFLRRDFAADLSAAQAAATKAQRALDRAARGEVVRELEAALQATQSLLTTLDSLVASIPPERARVGLRELGEQAGPLLDGAGRTRAALAEIRTRIDSGVGNVGRARVDLRRELEATQRSLDLLMLKYLGPRTAARRPNAAVGSDSVR